MTITWQQCSCQIFVRLSFKVEMLDTKKWTGLHAHTHVPYFNTLQMSRIPLNFIQENFPNSANDFNGK